jgi:hypothetical protein
LFAGYGSLLPIFLTLKSVNYFWGAMKDAYSLAFYFVSDYSNWKAITKLADYILESNKNIITCEEVVSVLEL